MEPEAATDRPDRGATEDVGVGSGHRGTGDVGGVDPHAAGVIVELQRAAGTAGGGSVGCVSGPVGVLLRVLAVVAVVAVALLVLAWALQRRLIYLPASGPVPSSVTVLPGSQEVEFDT